jgi:hypothetical protein
MVSKSFTGIVRPFQTPNIQPPAAPQSATTGTTQSNTKLAIGHGSPKTFTGTYDLTVAYYKVRKPKEKQKQQ